MKLVLAATIAALAVPASAEAVRVSTKAGVIVGEAADGVRVFRGVPYAQPPVGPLRWAAPKPIAWKGPRQATAFAPPCLQPDGANGRPNGGGHSGPSSEDCLYLNVWAPAATAKAPIMLWLYGGGGIMGGGHLPGYSGDAFARDGVVLVTINYRLGALGGFAHPSLTRAGDGLGNYHLLDALAAIRWIKANATAFGGDPDNITVFGESAGATMVANLLAMPGAKGLFAKAIIQSTGSLPTPATPLADAEVDGAKAATLLGLRGADATADELRALPADKIVLDRRTGFGHRTILDGRVVTRSIMDAFTGGTAHDIPLVIGTNSDEGRLNGTQRVATYAMSGAPVWQYFFDYVPEWRRSEQPNGVPHAGEIPYVFETVGLDARMADRDKAVAAQVHSCWVAFAWAGPGARSLTCADGFAWPSRSEANGRSVAIFQERPHLGRAEGLRSPPNGAKPGPTSRESE